MFSDASAERCASGRGGFRVRLRSQRRPRGAGATAACGFNPRDELMGRRRRGVRGPGVGTLVSRAWSGDTEAARAVLELFCEAVERGDVVPTPILRYVAGKFRLLLADKRSPADEILGVKRRYRPKSQLKAKRDEQIAAFVWAAVRRGWKREAAIDDAIKKFSVSKTTVENSLRLHGELARGAIFRQLRRDISMLFPEERAALRIRLLKKRR